MFKRILVPVDGSETSDKALRTALQLAGETGGRVRVLHAIDELAYLSGFEYTGAVASKAREYAQKAIDDALAIAKSAGVQADSRLLETPGRRLGDVVADEARSMACGRLFAARKAAELEGRIGCCDTLQHVVFANVDGLADAQVLGDSPATMQPQAVAASPQPLVFEVGS